jgi:hypothetical protein
VLPGEIADAEERCRGSSSQVDVTGIQVRARARESCAPKSVGRRCLHLLTLGRRCSSSSCSRTRARRWPGRWREPLPGRLARVAPRPRDAPSGRTSRAAARPRSRRPPSRASCRRSVLLGRPAPAVRARAPTINLAHPILCRYVRI